MEERLVFEKTKTTDYNACTKCGLDTIGYCVKDKNELTGRCIEGYNYKLKEQQPLKTLTTYEHNKARLNELYETKNLEPWVDEEIFLLEKWCDANKPETWETCTKENTKVSDTVRRKSNKELRIIECFCRDGSIVLYSNVGNSSFQVYKLEEYEINTNKEE